MLEAYRAALAAVGNSDPNPAVGAVVVSDNGAVIARGATQRAGHAHAERFALSQIPDSDLSKATLYVTLEPCCHHGRTPPCIDAILERRIKRVVIAERDFAAEVMGRSVRLLEEQGVDVSLMDGTAFVEEAWLTTGPFFFARKHNRPRITLKWAQTSDGAVAPQSGPSGKISGTDAAFITAALRHYHKFTLATPGAVAQDKPRLSVRFESEPPALQGAGLPAFFLELLLKQPGMTREMAVPEQTAIKPAFRGFLAKPLNPIERGEIYEMQRSIDKNFRFFPYVSEIWRADFGNALRNLLSEILAQGFNSVLVEAGPEFSELLLQHQLVDALAIYRSREKTAVGLWGHPGRSNSVSLTLAADGNVAGFKQMASASLDTDDFYFLKRR